MATRTLMATAGTIDRGPESRTVHHRIFYDVEHSNHSIITKQIFRAMVDMCHTVIELGEFASVPAVGGADEIARDALQLVNIG